MIEAAKNPGKKGRTRVYIPESLAHDTTFSATLVAIKVWDHREK
jgi:hypothetical protein